MTTRQGSLLEQTEPVRLEQRTGDGSDDLARAMNRAGKYLALKPRTRVEMGERLAQGGFDEATVDAALDRLVELRLLNDSDYARTWIEDNVRRKSLGPDALMAGLEAKGVEREVAAQALTDLGYDEESRATEAAHKLLRRVLDHPLNEQGRRLMASLMRKGFSAEAAEAGARAVLPPEGWD